MKRYVLTTDDKDPVSLALTKYHGFRAVGLNEALERLPDISGANRVVNRLTTLESAELYRNDWVSTHPEKINRLRATLNAQPGANRSFPGYWSLCSKMPMCPLQWYDAERSLLEIQTPDYSWSMLNLPREFKNPRFFNLRNPYEMLVDHQGKAADEFGNRRICVDLPKGKVWAAAKILDQHHVGPVGQHQAPDHIGESISSSTEALASLWRTNYLEAVYMVGMDRITFLFASTRFLLNEMNQEFDKKLELGLREEFSDQTTSNGIFE